MIRSPSTAVSRYWYIPSRSFNGKCNSSKCADPVQAKSVSENPEGFELRNWPCPLIVHWISMTQRTSTYFICIKTFHSFDHLRSHCFTEKEIGDEKTLSRASGVGLVAATGRLPSPCPATSWCRPWWMMTVRPRSLLNSTQSRRLRDPGRKQETGKLDVWILMIPSCCHSSCFLVFLLHQATDGERKSKEDQYWEEMWDIAKTALFAAQFDLRLTADAWVSCMSMMVPRRSEDRDEDEARCPCFGMCLVFRVTQNN